MKQRSHMETERIAGVLVSLADDLEALEAVLLPALVSCGAIQSGPNDQLQKIDKIVQSLNGLASFVVWQAQRRHDPNALSEEAYVAAFPVRALAQQLMPHVRPPEPKTDPVELF